jgi:PAS domain S-box-containing protein
MFSTTWSIYPAAIALTGLDDGRVLDENETWLAMTGERREAVLGRSTRHMRPNDKDARRFLDELRAKGTPYGWEQAFRRSSGEIFVTQISAQILTVRGERAILTTLVDITARKRSEDALLASEERYRMLFERMDEGFCTIEVLFDSAGHPVDYRFLSVYPTFELQSGSRDAVGRRVREIAP